MVKIISLALSVFLLVSLTACGGGSHGGSTESSATLTGTVDSFTASVVPAKKSLYMVMKELVLSNAYAAVSGVTVSTDSGEVTTGSDGSFSLSIALDDYVVTFSQGSASAEYLLADIVADETITLDDVVINGSDVSTAHTGEWEGYHTVTDSELGTMTIDITLSAGGNTFSGTIYQGETYLWALTGTENGSGISGTITVTDTECTNDTGTITGTFSGTGDDTTLTGSFTKSAGTCSASTGTFTATK